MDRLGGRLHLSDARGRDGLGALPCHLMFRRSITVSVVPVVVQPLVVACLDPVLLNASVAAIGRRRAVVVVDSVGTIGTGSGEGRRAGRYRRLNARQGFIDGG